MPVVKVVELIGVSKKSFDDAISEALKRASKTIRNITGLKVLGFTADVEKGKIVSHKANVRIAFLVEE